MTMTTTPQSPARLIDQAIAAIDAALAPTGPSRPVLREDLCNIGRRGYTRGIRDVDPCPVHEPDDPACGESDLCPAPSPAVNLTTEGLAALARRAPRNAFWHVERVA